MTFHRTIALTLIGCVTLSLGCRHRCHKARNSECSVPAPVIGGPPTPFRGESGATLPPTNIPRSNFSSPIPDSRRPEILLPSTPPSTSGASPRSAPVIVYPPTGVDTAATSPEPAKAMPKGSNAPSADLFPAPPSTATTPLPTGIAEFAKVRDNVYSGLKPNLDGLDWLKKNGFKTVVRLRKPTDTDEADQPLVERQGLKFVSLSVAPESIDQALIDQFNNVVGNTDQQPILVYDKDGSLAGAIWYLHFRTAGLLKDDEALLNAKKHGLRENGNAEQVALWLAVQKFLSEKP